MIGVLGMLSYNSLTHLAIETTATILIFTRIKCFNAIILLIFLTPSLHMTFISTWTDFKIKLMSILSPMTRAKDGLRSLPVEKNTPEQQICCTGMSITFLSPTLLVLYLIYKSINNVKIYADNAFKAFRTKSHLPNMSVFASARTLCRCFTCLRL